MSGLPRQSKISIECVSSGKVEVSDEGNTFKYSLDRSKEDELSGVSVIGDIAIDFNVSPHPVDHKLPISIRMMRSKLPALVLIQLIIIFAFADVQSIVMSCSTLIADNIIPIVYLLILQLIIDPTRSVRTFWSVVVGIMKPMLNLFQLLWRARKRKPRQVDVS